MPMFEQRADAVVEPKFTVCNIKEEREPFVNVSDGRPGNGTCRTDYNWASSTPAVKQGKTPGQQRHIPLQAAALGFKRVYS